ncbi:MAG: type IV toxin-antitoxin system AbiEi family antitoxin domain-containing protein [Gemmatimonadota bacterium]|nr:type IV toxin-antitoxin system AbiEi family antitoxin domain-containing protein [Gemmatimonadota bacterium]
MAALAERQHGVVARRQLLDLGLDRSAIDRRLSRGLLIPLHRGVFAVGHAQLRIEGRWMAAVLAVGEGAVLSHRDAAALHGMRTAPESRKVSVTTSKDARGTSALWVYARRTLTDDDRAEIKGIPVTSPARTLVDLAPMLTAAQLQSTLGEADRRGLLDTRAVHEALRRTRGRHGQGHQRLLAALDAHERHGAALLRSELEERFLDLVMNAGLPRPLLNAPAAGFEVDALWPDARLAVELDGWANHKERQAAARDRDKTNKLQAAGYRVYRFLHGDLVHRPADVAAAIGDALTACGT